MSEETGINVKELMPYIIAMVALACLTALAYNGTLPQDQFISLFLLIIGYIFGGITTNASLRLKVKKLQG